MTFFSGHKIGMNFGLQMFPLNITEPFLTQDSEGCVLGFTDILGFKFRLFVFLYFLSLNFHNFTSSLVVYSFRVVSLCVLSVCMKSYIRLGKPAVCSD